MKPSSRSQSNQPPQSSHQAVTDVKEFWHHILARLSETMKNLLHPSLYERTLREIGVRLGREVVDHLRRSRTTPPASLQEDYLRCLAWAKTSLKWTHTVQVDATDRIYVQIPHCPFGRLTVDDPHLCQVEAGLLGGIAGDLFGYAKVAIRRDAEIAPKGCTLNIHLKRTPQSLAVEGPTYPLPLSADKGPQTLSSEARTFDQLSPRERQIVRLVGEGLSDKEIAGALNLSVRTVEGHMSRIREKTGLGSRSAFIRWAIQTSHMK